MRIGRGEPDGHDPSAGDDDPLVDRVEELRLRRRHISRSPRFGQDTVSFVGAQATFAYTCVVDPSTPRRVTPVGPGTITVPVSDASYLDPANSSAWCPSGSPSDPSAYQGSIVLPSGLCIANGLVRLQKKGTFNFGIESTGNREKVNVRWHYNTGGSAGAWSGTLGVVPN